jgi:hypothetical protein
VRGPDVSARPGRWFAAARDFAKFIPTPILKE